MNKLFSSSLAFSFALHVPFLFQANFTAKPNLEWVEEVPTETLVYYVPAEKKDRKMQMHSVIPKSGYQVENVESLSLEKEPSRVTDHVLEQEHQIFPSIRKGSVLPSINPAHKKQEQKKKLVPTVENIQLNNAEEERIFYAYYDTIREKIKKHTIYPKQAKQMFYEGVAYVSFVLKRTGAIREIVLLESSGNELLDSAAINSIRNAAPFAAFPSELDESDIKLNIPISFELR